MIHEFTLLTYLNKTANSYSNLKKDFTNHLLGYLGEKKLDYYLEFLPDIGIYVLHGLRLKGTKYFYQVDTFFLTPFFCLVVEIKNLSGTLFFDKYSKQCFQTTTNTIRKGIDNPLTQAERQTHQLRKKLNMLGFYKLPIEYVVLICSPSTKIETNPGNEKLFESVFHMEYLVDRFQTLLDKYKEKAISDKNLKNLAINLALEHSPQKPDLIKKLSIDKNDLKTGIYCQTCLGPMIWVSGSWYCVSCKTSSKNAHEIGILHNLLNLHPTITNKEWREFAGISYSKNLSYRMLSALAFLKRQEKNYKNFELVPEWSSIIDLEPHILFAKF